MTASQDVLGDALTLSPKGARMLSGRPYAKYRRLLEAKCSRADVGPIGIEPAWPSTIGAVGKHDDGSCSAHAAATGVIVRRGRS
jgi:hypothetical protein